jgi:hypothetical protein
MQSENRRREILIDALRQALATPGEHRLFRAGKLAGLFPGRTGLAGELADEALAQGWLRRCRVETRGKTTIDWVEITPAGVEHLHAEESPVQALHQLRDALRHSQQALPNWLDEMSQLLQRLERQILQQAENWQQRLQNMEHQLNDTLRRLEAATPLVPPEVLHDHPWAVDALNYLDRRRVAGAPAGCPMPELFAAVVAQHPQLPLQQFHEGLRILQQRRALLLQPADDVTQLTRPELALFDGDRIFYLVVR